jgi:hypothetical protein
MRTTSRPQFGRLRAQSDPTAVHEPMRAILREQQSREAFPHSGRQFKFRFGCYSPLPTAQAFSSSSVTNSSEEICVASSTTGGATPASSASRTF